MFIYVYMFMYMLSLQRPEDRFRFPGAGVIRGYEGPEEGFKSQFSKIKEYQL